MKGISQTELLDIKILELRKQQKVELSDLKEHFIFTKNSLAPSNLIKEGLTDVYESVTSKNHILSTAVGLLSGFLAKKAITGNNKNNNILKKIIGVVVQFSIPTIINKLNTKTDEEHN